MVRSATHDPDDIVRAMRRGDFYASSGVELVDVRFDSTRMTIDIDAEEGVTYRTEFIGATREDDDTAPTRPLASARSKMM